MVLPVLGAVLGGALSVYKAKKAASAAKAMAAAGAVGVGGTAAASFLPEVLTEGPEIFEGTPDNPSDAGGATHLRWDREAEKFVPYRPRRRRRTGMTKGQMAAFAFLRSQGVAADKAAGLVMSGVGR